MELQRGITSAAAGQGWRITIKEEGSHALRECLPENLFELCVATSIKQATTLAVTDHELNPKFVKPVPVMPVDAGFGCATPGSSARHSPRTRCH